jgi:hypothetical protein
MITFFTIPKSFIGHSGIIQYNAIRSWCKLAGNNVILFGDDVGVAELAKELELIHYSEIEKNEYDTPMVSDAFKIAQKISKTPYIAYVNSDIIFTDSFIKVLKNINITNPKWVMVGQRIDLDINMKLDFSNDAYNILKILADKNSVLHGKAGIDYFIFPNKIQLIMPDFAVGRPGWDSWLVYSIRKNKYMLIDATSIIKCYHQNHPPAYKQYNSEALKNKKNAGGYLQMGTIRDANWKILKKKNKYVLRKNWVGVFYFSSFIRFLLSYKRSIFEYLS